MQESAKTLLEHVHALVSEIEVRVSFRSKNLSMQRRLVLMYCHFPTDSKQEPRTSDIWPSSYFCNLLFYESCSTRTLGFNSKSFANPQEQPCLVVLEACASVPCKSNESTINVKSRSREIVC